MIGAASHTPKGFPDPYDEKYWTVVVDWNVDMVQSTFNTELYKEDIDKWFEEWDWNRNDV